MFGLCSNSTGSPFPSLVIYFCSELRTSVLVFEVNYMLFVNLSALKL